MPTMLFTLFIVFLALANFGTISAISTSTPIISRFSSPAKTLSSGRAYRGFLASSMLQRVVSVLYFYRNLAEEDEYSKRSLDVASVALNAPVIMASAWGGDDDPSRRRGFSESLRKAVLEYGNTGDASSDSWEVSGRGLQARLNELKRAKKENRAPTPLLLSPYKLDETLPCPKKDKDSLALDCAAAFFHRNAIRIEKDFNRNSVLLFLVTRVAMYPHVGNLAVNFPASWGVDKKLLSSESESLTYRDVYSYHVALSRVLDSVFALCQRDVDYFIQCIFAHIIGEESPSESPLFRAFAGSLQSGGHQGAVLEAKNAESNKGVIDALLLVNLIARESGKLPKFCDGEFFVSDFSASSRQAVDSVVKKYGNSREEENEMYIRHYANDIMRLEPEAVTVENEYSMQNLARLRGSLVANTILRAIEAAPVQEKKVGKIRVPRRVMRACMDVLACMLLLPVYALFGVVSAINLVKNFVLIFGEKAGRKLHLISSPASDTLVPGRLYFAPHAIGVHCLPPLHTTVTPELSFEVSSGEFITRVTGGADDDATGDRLVAAPSGGVLWQDGEVCSSAVRELGFNRNANTIAAIGEEESEQSHGNKKEATPYEEAFDSAYRMKNFLRVFCMGCDFPAATRHLLAS